MPQPYHPFSIRPQFRRSQHQRGVALFIVIVLVMLSMLLVLWASRTSLFNEMVVGNDADYQRAFEAAQALLQDAELDIRGEAPNGALCTQSPCRNYNASVFNYPAEGKEINPLVTKLQAEATWCKNGLCARRTGRQDFWNYTSAGATPDNLVAGEIKLEDMQTVGARYGDYTGANKGNDDIINPILKLTGSKEGGWYWIEVLPYSDKAKSAHVIADATSSQLALNLDVYVVYRITALAYGRKPGTMVVLQETYARQRMKD